jgi:thiol:disulfide interchange protein
LLDNDIPQGKSFSGILTSAAGSITIPDTVIFSDAVANKPTEALPVAKYLPILWGMLVGGLILNLMPCVFPVIGLKIMGFVQQAGSDRKKIALHGVAFTAGVLASFGVLSGILFAAREAARSSVGPGADSIGWGYQLQNPWVVLILMLLMFVLALNMFGVFELGTSATSVGGSLQAKQGIGGSFFSGVLATIVATPCSAPFLGVAIGSAIGLPAFQFFSAFGAMAIGLSLPYLILSVFPKLIDHLPRPGAWMESFKQAMSFFLFATAGYLLWVYAGQIGLDNLLGPIFGLSGIAVAAWIYGRWNLPHRTRNTRWAATLLAVLFAAGGFMLAKPPQKSALVWESWSQERVDALLAEGKPVYIDFTAQWCATCQVNKKTAYTKEVIALMQKKGVVALKADKTNADPKIEAKLQELGRSAIPVNVLLVPDKKPVITPELLTSGYLNDLFSKEIPAN